jgi:hypothetical protein
MQMAPAARTCFAPDDSTWDGPWGTEFAASWAAKREHQKHRNVAATENARRANASRPAMPTPAIAAAAAEVRARIERRELARSWVHFAVLAEQGHRQRRAMLLLRTRVVVPRLARSVVFWRASYEAMLRERERQRKKHAAAQLRAEHKLAPTVQAALLRERQRGERYFMRVSAIQSDVGAKP